MTSYHYFIKCNIIQYQFISSSVHHFTISFLHHIIISLFHHFIIPPFHYFIIPFFLSFHNFIKSPFHQIIMTSWWKSCFSSKISIFLMFQKISSLFLLLKFIQSCSVWILMLLLSALLHFFTISPRLSSTSAVSLTEKSISLSRRILVFRISPPQSFYSRAFVSQL